MATKAQLIEQIQQLEALNAELSQQVSQQVQEHEQPRPEVNLLTQILWLPRELDLSDPRVCGTHSTGKRFIRFRARYNRLDERTGNRHYGPYRSYRVVGTEACNQLLALIRSEQWLARVEAFESPWTDGSKRSDWVVRRIISIPRVEKSAQEVAPEVPFAQGPVSEPVPF